MISDLFLGVVGEEILSVADDGLIERRGPCTEVFVSLEHQSVELVSNVGEAFSGKHHKECVLEVAAFDLGQVPVCLLEGLACKGALQIERHEIADGQILAYGARDELVQDLQRGLLAVRSDLTRDLLRECPLDEVGLEVCVVELMRVNGFGD